MAAGQRPTTLPPADETTMIALNRVKAPGRSTPFSPLSVTVDDFYVSWVIVLQTQLRVTTRACLVLWRDIKHHKGKETATEVYFLHRLQSLRVS